MEFSGVKQQQQTVGPYANPFGQYGGDEPVDDKGSWEEIPECGKLKNVILKPGDHISRVKPDSTSCLRRSRWQKKNFPQGTFPYK
jgi:hypothetical protein